MSTPHWMRGEPDAPRQWRQWQGVTGLLYASQRHSPPIVVCAPTPAMLAGLMWAVERGWLPWHVDLPAAAAALTAQRPYRWQNARKRPRQP